MTIQNLIDAIAEALFQTFGSGCDIYTEKVEQNMSTPCFLIRCLNPTLNVHLGQCYKRTNLFSIQYIPSSAEANEECYSVLEKLFECLNDVILPDGKPLHGQNLNGEVTDGTLTFTVNYDGFVYRKPDDPEPEMVDYEVSTDVKG